MTSVYRVHKKVFLIANVSWAQLQKMRKEKNKKHALQRNILNGTANRLRNSVLY